MDISTPVIRIVTVSLFLALIFILVSPIQPRYSVEAVESHSISFNLPAESILFQVGEELQYNVSYSFFDIGIIKMQVVDTGTYGGISVFKMKAFVDSYSGLPFVDLHQAFYSEMTLEAFSIFFITHNTAKQEQKPFTRYRFDYKNNKVRYEFGVEPDKTIKNSGEEVINGQQLDGLSLFYFARKNFRKQMKVSVPVFVNEKSYKTHFNFMNKVGETEIDALTYPIETIEFDGTSDFTGIFGLTGYFKGFFSNDEAGVPIVAKMKVILGSVHIELIKWNRSGWVPPPAVE